MIANAFPMLTLAQWGGWVMGVVITLFVVVCVLMVLTVLIQKPQGGGLAGAFGSGAGSGQTAFGTKTGDALTVFTCIVFALMVVLAVALNFGIKPAGPVRATAGPAPMSTPADAPANTPALPAEPKPAPTGGEQAPAGNQPAQTSPSTGTPESPAQTQNPPPAQPSPADSPVQPPKP